MRGNYKNRRDANEPEIIATLQAFGIDVRRMDTPCDLLCGFAGKTYIAEVKDGPKAKFTPAQEMFLDTWRGQFVRLNTVQDAEEWAQKIRRENGRSE